MATRVNTKFVFILAVALLAATGIVGGLWVLHIRGDTSRHISAGDEFMAEGEYERALKEYGRAVDKEPSNMGHLAKVETALLAIRPTNRDQAAEYDEMRIGILRHRTTYRTDSDAYLAYLTDVHRLARWFDSPQMWQQLVDVGGEMWERLPSSDSNRAYGKLYRGLARNHLLSTSTSPELEIDNAERDLVEFLEVFPDHDLGWASLVAGQMIATRQFRGMGDDRRAEEKYVGLKDTVDRAVEAVPDGTEVALAVALYLTVQRSADAASVSSEAIDEAVNRLLELVTPAGAREMEEGSGFDPILLAEASTLLRSLDQQRGLERSIGMLSTYVAANPQQLYQRFMLATLYNIDGEFDKAVAEASAVIDAGPVPVSILSRIQHILRLRAASLIVDVEYRRWELAEEADKPPLLESVRAARERLASLVGDPENEPLLLSADGKISLAKKDYADAAARFERVIRLNPMALEAETLWNSALALEQVGQLGMALQRMQEAAILQPRNAPLLAERARLEYRVGRFDEALQTIAQALKLKPDLDAARRIQIAIEATMAAAGKQDAADPAARALQMAESAIEEGDLAAAHAALTAALADEPDSLPVLGELVRVELRRGNVDTAREHLDHALRLQPNNQFLRRLDASLSTNDQVEALKQYMAGQYEDEADRTVHTIIHLDALSTELTNLAQARTDAGDAEGAETARASAARARAEADALTQRANEIAPGHPLLVEHLFKSALNQGDWDRVRELVELAQRVDADDAGGMIFRGRYELAREDHQAAVRSLTEATSRKNYSSLAWRLLGRSHEHLGNFSEALRAYEQAYDCNPNDKYSVRWYVNVLMQTGEKTGALRVLRNSRNAIPDDFLLREARLQLEAEVGDVLAAMDERRRIYAESPDDRLNALRLAGLLGRTTPTFEHIVDADGKRKYEAERWTVLPASERQKMLQEVSDAWVSESDEIIKAVAAGGDDTLELASLRADLARSRGRIDDGEAILQSYVERHRANPTVEGYIALGAYQAEVNKLEASVATLESARQLPGVDVDLVDRAMADVYFNRSLFDQAYPIYRRLYDNGALGASTLRLVECATKVNRFAEAETLLQEVVAASGADYLTAMLSATIEQGRGDELFAAGSLQEAETHYAREREALDRAERLQPSNPMPDVRRAQAILRQFRQTGKMNLLDDALRQLQRADEKQAGAEATSVVRVDILRKKGDVRGAIGELARLLERSPDHAAARRLLIQLHVETGNHDAAMAAVTEAINRNPTVALWHEMKGDLWVVRRDVTKALAEFKEALRYQRSSSRLVKVVEASLALPEPDYAQIADMIGQMEDLLPNSPYLRAYYAVVLNGAKRRDAAIQQMRAAYAEHRQAIELQESARSGLSVWFQSLQVIYRGHTPAEMEQLVMELCGDKPDVQELLWLARSWFFLDPSGGSSRAIELGQSARSQCRPEDVVLLSQIAFDIGQFMVMAGEYRSAAESFEESITLNPDQPLALNNAAYIYAEHLGEPQKAIPYASRALELRPDDPYILDTLGWAQFRAGSLKEAEDSLRRAVELAPSADNNLHLATVLARTDQPRKAEIYLRRASELDPDDETQKQIDELENEIRSQVKTP